MMSIFPSVMLLHSLWLLFTFPASNNGLVKAWTPSVSISTARHTPHPLMSLGSTSSSVDSDTTSTSSSQQQQHVQNQEIIHHSPFLGEIYKIEMDQDDDFLAANAVPTFAAKDATTSLSIIFNNTQKQRKARGLEGALQQGPAFVLDNVLSSDVCQELMETFETQLGFAQYQAGKNHHGALQIVVPASVTDAVGQVLSPHIDIEEVEARRTEMMVATSGQDDAETHDVRLVFAGLNRRWRVYRYAPGGEETFAPHIDAGFPPSGLTPDGNHLVWDDSASFVDADSDDGSEIVSRLTLLMYLNDDFVGGETKFYQPNNQNNNQNDSNDVIAAVRPVAGSCLVFPQGVGEDAVEHARQHWPLHEGSPVLSSTSSSNRPKYVIRSDILFATTKEPLLLEDPLWNKDQLVRQTFLPTSSVMDKAFLSHAKSLYNPHMGVENIATLLYSLIRFTKKRRIVEIGAGYTSLWILQALKDNDEEMKRIRQLNQKGDCKLLNIPWTVQDELDRYNDDDVSSSSSSLLCIDNCEHQKETATGACAVAKSLGLDSYLQFVKGDAFEMGDFLEEASIDMLWADFGVGSRMKEFLSEGAWASLKPGGLLLCHSTLTNQRTRNWLEAARAHKGEDITGIPPDEYVELSLLEPHKNYQNSVSIFQKRKTGDDIYAEPIFSEYA